MSFALFYGDCEQVMRQWPEKSVDALVMDPPAGISFMGREWDDDKGGRNQWVAWLAGVMREALRLLKPGAYGLVWALPRTSHWTGWALEEAGFEVRDRVSHFFGTGFPKSVDLGNGLGSALKPACEDWWLIQRPRVGTYESNIERYGTGALNIDACRLPAGDRKYAQNFGPTTYERASAVGDLQMQRGASASAIGRWPAHVVFDEAAAALLDQQSGESKSTGSIGADTNAAAAAARGQVSAYGPHTAPRGEWKPYGDEGGASRFFFVAKPSAKERDYGCEGLPVRNSGEMTGGRKEGSAGLKSPRAGAGRTSGARNYHPTLKSIALMRYLCRLVTPPGGLVLDPFCGSGSTGIAALREGLRFVGIEKELEYLTIAVARIGTADKENHHEESEAHPAAVAATSNAA